MQTVLNFLLHSFDGLILYILLFLVGSFVLYHLARLKNQRAYLFTTIKIISSVLGNKFGSKASDLLEIFVERKISCSL